MGVASPSAGDVIAPNCKVIEVHVGELKQLFNAIDPSPFREKDLDPTAEDFIVGWARDVPPDAPLALLVYLDRPPGVAGEAGLLRDAVHEYFRHRADGSRQRLRQLFRRGRTSLLIGVAFLTASLLLGDLIGNVLRDRRIGEVLRESLMIGGWVAMWRPLEIFLYDWWPIRQEATLFTRLGAMPVRIAYNAATSSDSWRFDWPAVPAAAATAQNVPSPSQDAREPAVTNPQVVESGDNEAKPR
jgi:hypothetical protein